VDTPILRTTTEEVAAGDPFAYAGSKLPEYSTRVQRALKLVEERGDEIEPLAGGVFVVPSQDGRRAYRVQYGEHEFCSCPDNTYRGVNCVHILAVGIASAKRRSHKRRGCSRCFGGYVTLGGEDENGEHVEEIECVPCRRCSGDL
jgi:hypothetical protein